MSGSAKKRPDPIVQHRQGGFVYLVPVLLGVTLVLSALALIPSYLDDIEAERKVTVATSQMAQLSEAIKGYVLNNAQALEASASPTAPFEIDIDDLADDGLLPDTFQPVNPWGQTYRTFAFLETSGGDNALKVLTVGQGGQPGGAAFRDLNDTEKRLVNMVIPQVAASFGSTGGFMPSNDYPGANNNRLQGAYGIWSMDIQALPFQPAQGALANLQFFTSGTLDNDYLYRVAVPGRPELNQMNTTLDMNGNDVANIESLTDMTGYIETSGNQLTSTGDVFSADQGNLTLRDGTVNAGDVVIDDIRIGGGSVPVSRAVFDMRSIRPNTTVPKPVCPVGSSSQIHLAVAQQPLSASNGLQTTSGTRAGNLLSSRARAVNSGSNWVVYLEANIDGTWYRLASSEGLLQVSPKCT